LILTAMIIKLAVIVSPEDKVSFPLCKNELICPHWFKKRAQSRILYMRN
jgi:hypothetical protein